MGFLAEAVKRITQRKDTGSLCGLCAKLAPMQPASELFCDRTAPKIHFSPRRANGPNCMAILHTYLFGVGGEADHQKELVGHRKRQQSR